MLHSIAVNGMAAYPTTQKLSVQLKVGLLLWRKVKSCHPLAELYEVLLCLLPVMLQLQEKSRFAGMIVCCALVSLCVQSDCQGWRRQEPGQAEEHKQQGLLVTYVTIYEPYPAGCWDYS